MCVSAKDGPRFCSPILEVLDGQLLTARVAKGLSNSNAIEPESKEMANNLVGYSVPLDTYFTDNQATKYPFYSLTVPFES